MNWRHWLPSPQQMSNAAQLRSKAYRDSTMQQALGMIVALALLAGLLPFVVHWFVAARADTVLPLAQAVRSAAQTQETIFGLGFGFPWPVNPLAVGELYQTRDNIGSKISHTNLIVYRRENPIISGHNNSY